MLYEQRPSCVEGAKRAPAMQKMKAGISNWCAAYDRERDSEI